MKTTQTREADSERMGEKQDSRCMMRPHGDSSLQSNKQTTDMGQDIEVWPDLISAESTAGAWQNRHRTPVPTALGSSSSPTQGNGCFLCIQYSITVEQCLHSQGIAFWTVVGQKDRISRCFFSGKKSQRLEALPCCASLRRKQQELLFLVYKVEKLSQRIHTCQE